MVEFWTFGCYSCRNTLPYVKRWHDRYSEKGLTIVGVHSPEFEEERNADNVRKRVASLGIRFPVVTDNDYQTWRAYKVEAWPLTSSELSRRTWKIKTSPIATLFIPLLWLSMKTSELSSDWLRDVTNAYLSTLSTKVTIYSYGKPQSITRIAISIV